MITVKVNKVYENPRTNKKGDSFISHNILGTTEDGGDFKASAISPICSGVKEGETYTFETVKRGDYTNITQVVNPEANPETPPSGKKIPPVYIGKEPAKVPEKKGFGKPQKTTADNEYMFVESLGKTAGEATKSEAYLKCWMEEDGEKRKEKVEEYWSALADGIYTLFTRLNHTVQKGEK